jgi:hypothetical protein
MTAEGISSRPVAAWGEQVVVSQQPAGEQGAAQQFAAWDPRSGARTTLWDGVEGQQDIVTAVDGDWAAVVRTGMALPFPEWQLTLRNLRTGESRLLAQTDPGVLKAKNLQPGLPLGFAPFAEAGGGRVTWVQHVSQGGQVLRRVFVYDIEARSVTAVAEANLAQGEDLQSATAGAGRVAWIRSDSAGKHSAIEVLDTGSGAVTSYEGPAQPFQIALAADGKSLAWDDGLTAKDVLDFDTGNVTQFAGDEGWGVMSSGGRYSWAPAAAYGGTGGVFDPATGTVRMLERRDGITTNFAQVLGPWFAWQETSGGDTGSYHFLWLGQ